VCNSEGVGRKYIGVVYEVVWGDMDLGLSQGFVTMLATKDGVRASVAVRNFMVIRRIIAHPSTYSKVSSVSIIVAIGF